MRASLVVLDADRRRHRHALHHLQHHPEAYFPYFHAGSLVFFLKLYGYFPLFPLKGKTNFFEANRYGTNRLLPRALSPSRVEMLVSTRNRPKL